MFLTADENLQFWKDIHDRIKKIHIDVEDALETDFSYGYLWTTPSTREKLGINTFNDFYMSIAYNLDFPKVVELEKKLDDLLAWVQGHLETARLRDVAYDNALRDGKAIMSTDEEEQGEYWAYPYDQAASLQILKEACAS